MSDSRYPILLNILDEICKAAPSTPEFSRFHSSEQKDVEYSRSQAYIHLLLQVRFGIVDFHTRDQLICDGKYDGGLDAIYIDKEDRIIYFIQSKFRHTSTNFLSTHLGSADLIKMEIRRIISGESTDSNNNPLNEKVRNLQALITQANRETYHEYKVIFLANIDPKINNEQILLFTDQFLFEIYNYERSYNELVRQVCAGTYYYSGIAKRPLYFSMELNLADKREPYAHQIANTSYGGCEIYLLYAPTKEIGRMMAKYKNAVLQYNPRNFLGLADKENVVNSHIQASITNIQENDFALLNNGITILADDAMVQPDTGTYNLGLLTMTNPQIVNGGQTAYTLGTLYENEFPHNPQLFDQKEVLLRIVKFPHSSSNLSIVDMDNERRLIRSLSDSTNQQTAIKEADRRSNDQVFRRIQDLIFINYGYLLQVKQGEFYNGHKKGYVNKEILIDREVALRSLIAFRSLDPVLARNGSATRLFSETDFNNFLAHKDDATLEVITTQMFLAYMIYNKLPRLRKSKKEFIDKYGYALIYGRYAVVTAISYSMKSGRKRHLVNQNASDLESIREEEVNRVLNKWKQFEEYSLIPRLGLDTENIRDITLGYDSYYKGKTLREDIKSFKW